jgi:hypothetical protein
MAHNNIEGVKEFFHKINERAKILHTAICYTEGTFTKKMLYMWKTKVCFIVLNSKNQMLKIELAFCMQFDLA